MSRFREWWHSWNYAGPDATDYMFLGFMSIYSCLFVIAILASVAAIGYMLLHLLGLPF